MVKTNIIKTKKAYVYTIEILVILLLLALFASVFTITCDVNKIPESQNLKKIGYNTLYNLDKEHLLENNFANNITNSNFTTIDLYIQKELPKTIMFETEYYYQDTCYSIGRSCGSSDLDNKNIHSIFYTYSKSSDPVTIKLYIWSAL